MVQSHNCLLLKDHKWKERQTFCCFIFITKTLFPSKGLDDRPLFFLKATTTEKLMLLQLHIPRPPFFPFIYRDGIHKSTISLRFLGIFLRFLRLEASIFIFAFYTNGIQEQTWVFFFDRFFCIDFRLLKQWGLYGFLLGFPPFDAFLILVFTGKYIPLWNVNKEIMKTKPGPHLLSAVAVEISSLRKPWRGE